MKWENKGKELDTYGLEVCQNYENHNGIVIFGAGDNGAHVYRMLKPFNLFVGFVDNSAEKQANGFENETGYPVEIVNDKNYFVILAGTESHMSEMIEQLLSFGLVLNKDFITCDEFKVKWFKCLLLYKFDTLYTELAQICVTERCTLKCKKCAHACHLVDINTEDMSLEEAKRSADNFFGAFNYVGEFVLIGGEPFLYKKLNELITYIGEKYRNKIDLFTITTNGTIIPQKETIEVCKKYNVIIRVSDYSGTIPKLKKRYGLLFETLKELPYSVWEKNEGAWFDYGFFDIILKDEKLILENFNNCKTHCREIKGNKYYYCVMAHTVAQNAGMDIGKDDYYLINDKLNRKELLEFDIGYSKKGYMDMCSRCRGNKASEYLIAAAEQVE